MNPIHTGLLPKLMGLAFFIEAIVQAHVDKEPYVCCCLHVHHLLSRNILSSLLSPNYTSNQRSLTTNMSLFLDFHTGQLELVSLNIPPNESSISFQIQNLALIPIDRNSVRRQLSHNHTVEVTIKTKIRRNTILTWKTSKEAKPREPTDSNKSL